MARARNIKPGFFKNEILGVADPLLSLLFEGLWVLADRAGRLEDRPMRIKGEIFPYRDGLDVNSMLDWLESNGFIRRYTADGKKCILVLEFVKHQNPHKNETESELPEPELKQSNTDKETTRPEFIGTKPDFIGSTRADSPTTDSPTTDSLIPESKTAPAKRAAPVGFTPPNWINLQHWQAWHSSPKRKKATNDQKQMAVDKLDAWRQNGEDFAGALENAAVGGYQGLFLPDKKPSQSGATETAYQRSMREKMEVMAPAIAAKAPGVPRTNPNNFFDALPNAKPLEITQ